VLTFLQHLGAQAGSWLYLIAGLLAFAEAAVMIGVVFPGETALLVAGLAAQRGWIALEPMIAIAVGAAAAGDSVGYELGRRLGPGCGSQGRAGGSARPAGGPPTTSWPVTAARPCCSAGSPPCCGP
jgi:hypothetical protein